MKVLWTAILSLAIIAITACGGGGTNATGAPSPTPIPTPIPTVSSGEYLFEGNGVSSLNISLINSSTGALSPPAPATVRANDEESYPGVAVTPSKKIMYALFSSFSLIEAYEISGPGLQLTSLPDAPFGSTTQEPTNSLILHPSGKFLYLIHSSSPVEEFSVNATTGDLTFASSVTEANADMRMAAIDPAGKFMFVTDLTAGRVFAYQINQVDGSLTAVTGSPFAVGTGSLPDFDLTDSTGSFLYVSTASGIAAFAINSSTGVLTSVPGSPFATTGAPVFIAETPQGSFFYSLNSNGEVDGFAINSTTGVLTVVPGSPFHTGSFPTNIAVDPLGKYVYVSTFTNSTIFGFSLDPTSGTLTAILGSPFPAVSNPTNLFIASFP